jgi:phosphohistidine phosphatase SixA
MEHLFLLRHGNYDLINGEYHLSSEGKRQFEILADLIQQRAESGVSLLSSSETVAIESARVLAERLDIDIQEATELWSGNPTDSPVGANLRGDPKLVHRLVELVEQRSNSIILVSHKEIGENYPRYFLSERMRLTDYIGALEKGQAYHFDLRKNCFTLLP